MANVLFTNVRIIDGSGAQPYSGEVLVQGNRIARVAKGVRAIATAGITVIDAAGATLMPGMTEAHTHFAWNAQPGLQQFSACRRRSTSCGALMSPSAISGWAGPPVGAAPAKPPRRGVRNAIASGQIKAALSRRQPEIGARRAGR
jgi:hypothetical protein